MANVLTMPVFSIYEEGAPKLSKIKHIFLFLTLLSLKVIFKDGQITPNTVTHPFHKTVYHKELDKLQYDI